MTNIILDKYNEVLPNGKAVYDSDCVPCITLDANLLSILDGLSEGSQLFFHRFVRRLPVVGRLSGSMAYVDALTVDVSVPGETRSRWYGLLGELVSSGVLVRVSRGRYCLNFAFCHRFSRGQLRRLQGMANSRQVEMRSNAVAMDVVAPDIILP